jgi:hypothetical protein
MSNILHVALEISSQGDHEQSQDEFFLQALGKSIALKVRKKL